MSQKKLFVFISEFNIHFKKICCLISFWYSQCSSISFAKQCGQGCTVTRIFWWGQFGSEIWMFHWQSIISALPSCTTPATYFHIFPTEVAKIGVSILNFISSGELFFGTAKWTSAPSSNCKKLLHGINLPFHLKSFRQTISAFSTPIHASMFCAGLANAQEMKRICHS